jgi:hypothetical protein
MELANPKSKHICNSHKLTHRPIIAKEYAFANTNEMKNKAEKNEPIIEQTPPLETSRESLSHHRVPKAFGRSHTRRFPDTHRDKLQRDGLSWM